MRKIQLCLLFSLMVFFTACKKENDENYIRFYDNGSIKGTINGTANNGVPFNFNFNFIYNKNIIDTYFNTDLENLTGYTDFVFDDSLKIGSVRKPVKRFVINHQDLSGNYMNLNLMMDGNALIADSSSFGFNYMNKINADTILFLMTWNYYLKRDKNHTLLPNAFKLVDYVYDPATGYFSAVLNMEVVSTNYDKGIDYPATIICTIDTKVWKVKGDPI